MYCASMYVGVVTTYGNFNGVSELQRMDIGDAAVVIEVLINKETHRAILNYATRCYM